MDAADLDRKVPRLPRRSLVFAVLLVGATVAVVSRFAEERQFSLMLSRAQPAWLLVALGLQAITYALRAGVWGSVLRRSGQRIGLHRLTRLSLAKHFADQAVPAAGVSGTLLIVRALERRGVARPTVMAAFVLQTAGSSAGIVLALLVGLGILATTMGHVPRVVQIGALIWVGANAVIAGVALLLARGRRVPLPDRVKKLRPVRVLLDATGEADPALIRDPRLLAASTVLNALVPVLDGLTLWALVHAVGVTASASSVYVAYVIAMLARDLSLVPGALGTFDAASIGVLTLIGLKLAPAAAATLLFRGFSLWLPLLPGLWAARQELLGGTPPPPGKPRPARSPAPRRTRVGLEAR